MNAPTRFTLSALAASVVLGASGTVFAESIETQHSIYDLARQTAGEPPVGQAGREGPHSMATTPMQREKPSTPAETRYSVYDLAARLHGDASE